MLFDFCAQVANVHIDCPRDAFKCAALQLFQQVQAGEHTPR